MIIDMLVRRMRNQPKHIDIHRHDEEMQKKCCDDIECTGLRIPPPLKSIHSQENENSDVKCYNIDSIIANITEKERER